MRVILCGYHWAGCKSLKLLLNERHEEEKKQRDKQDGEQHKGMPNFGNLSNLTKSFNPSSYRLPKL
ncbi:MAG: hypothetical protein WCR55_12665 [Lentisphaerota bacterium]